MKAKMLVTLSWIAGIVAGLSIGAVSVWFFWPYAVGAMFPGWVESGHIAAELTFWQSVAVSFLSATLFKASSGVRGK